MSRRLAVALLAPLSVVLLAAACGSRTGILLPGEETPSDAASLDAAPDAPEDAAEDANEDTTERPDGQRDAGEEDALPPIDVRLPPPDAPNPCPDAGDTLIYLITEQNTLISFYPPTGTFTRIGTIQCPVRVPGATPFSMAVDETGIADVVFTDGNLYRVSTATASCRATPFVSGQQGFPARFGMAFSRNPNGVDETLYLAGDPPDDDAGEAVPSILAAVDPTMFLLSTIGQFRGSIYGPELTGTGAGELYAFYSLQRGNSNVGSTAIGQIDKTTGQVVAESPLPGVIQGCGWAFAFWGGDFYVFTAPDGAPACQVANPPSIVTRFSASDGSIVKVASTTETIVGAGVSTCAPAQ